MDFETLASNEITAVVARLAQAATDAREQAVKALETAHADELRALSAEHTAAFEQINGALLKAHSDRETALRQLQTNHDDALRQLQAAHEAALAQIQSEHDQLLTASEQERTQALDSLTATHQAAVTEITRGHEATVAQLTASHEAALQEMNTSQEAIVAELNDAQQQMAEHARRQLTVVTAENNRLMAEYAALEKQQAELLEAQVEDTRKPLLAHLNAASGRIIGSRNVAEVFCAVAEGLTYDFSRVVVFEVKEQRLEAIHQHGFGNIALDRLSTSRKDAPLLARALQSPDAHRHAQGESPALAFAGSPGTTLTAPITVHGETLAIIYADDGGAQNTVPDDDCTALAALLQQQASLRLDRLTIELKAMAELRAYARMLVDEAEYVYNADVSAGKSDNDRISQLQDNIRCARQIFVQRVTSEGPAAVSVLDDVVAERLRAQSGSGFATDLGNLLLQGDLESNAA